MFPARRINATRVLWNAEAGARISQIINMFCSRECSW